MRLFTSMPRFVLAISVMCWGCNVLAPGQGPVTPEMASPKSGGSRLPAGLTSTLPGPNSSPAQLAAKGFFGKVVGLDGNPAMGVVVRGYVISNNGAGLISVAGGSLIGKTRYELNQASFEETRTAADGTFRIVDPGSRPLNLEAVAADDLKAFAPAVTGATRELIMTLAPTGTLTGRVRAEDAGVSNLLGTSVYIPGTSYLALTDAGGVYTIANVPVGTFDLVASKIGPGTGGAANVQVRSREITTVSDITLVATRPQIEDVQPTVALPGTRLTIRGSHFGRTIGAPIQVTIGGALALDANAKDDQTIEATVPNGVTYSADQEQEGNEGRSEVVVAVGGVLCPAPGVINLIEDFVVVVPSPWMRPGQEQTLKLFDSEDVTKTFVPQGMIPDLSGADPDGAEYGRSLPLTADWQFTAGSQAVTLVDGRLVAIRPGRVEGKVTSGRTSHPFSITVTDKAYVETSSPLITPAFADSTYVRMWPVLAREAEGIYHSFANTERGKKVSPDSEISLSFALPRSTNKLINYAVSLTVPAVPGQEPSPLSRVAGLVFAAPHTLYGVNARRHGVVAFTPGASNVLAGAGTAGFLDGPGATALFSAPTGIALGKGFLVIADRDNQRIRRVDLNNPTFPVSTLAGNGALGLANGTGSAATFDGPGAVAFDPAGNLFVADTNNHCIRKIALDDPAHPVTTFAGSGAAGFADGTSAVAQFNNPRGLAFDAKGNLYVADSSNYRIRLVDPKGHVTTFAGHAKGFVPPEDSLKGGVEIDHATFARPTALLVDDDRGVIMVVDGDPGPLQTIFLPGSGGVPPLSPNPSLDLKPSIFTSRRPSPESPTR